MSHLDEALSLLDQAFGPPVYMGELSRPQLRSAQSGNLLLRALRILAGGQASKGGDALSHYFLGVLYRYMERCAQDSRNHLKLALHYDPNFLEAEIALRDGELYLDPFAYPKWEDLRDGQAGFRPSALQACDPKGCRVDLVRCDSLLIPAVILRYPQTSFRSPLTERTAARILLHVEMVPPTMPALGHVVAVIFDDADDPFFCSSYLNLFPVQTTHGDIPVIHPSDYRPLAGRDAARRFCQEPGRCALFVLNTEDRLMMARLIDFDESERLHLRETGEVLKILGDKILDGMTVWRSAVTLHDGVFVREIQNPEGRMIRIPKDRDEKQARQYIMPIVARGGRLEVIGTETADAASYRRRNDIFISHAHADAAWVGKIRDWLKHVWPSLRVFRTDPEDQDRYKRDPHYFIKEMARSRCLIFLATPRSIDRPMVGFEIRSAARKPLIALLAGGLTREDLLRREEEDLFSRLDAERAVSMGDPDGWEQLALRLAEELRLSLPERIPDGPVLRAEDIREGGPTDPGAEYVRDYFDMVKRSGTQTESLAEDLLEVLEEEVGKRAAERGEEIRWDMLAEVSLRSRLIFLLLGETRESVTKAILDLFPALVDEDLIDQLNEYIDYSKTVHEDDCRQLIRLLGIVEKRLSGS